MQPAGPSRTARLLGFATIYVVWGTTYLAIRVAVAGLPPFFLAGWRFVAAGAVLYGAVRRFGGALRPGWRDWRRQALAGICLVGGNAVMCWAEQSVPSGLSALGVGVAPMFMVTIAWMMPGGLRPSRLACAGIALGLIGLVVLFGPGAFPAGTRPPAPRVMALFVSSAIWCLGSVWSKHAGSKAEPLLAAAMQMIVGGGAMLAVSVLLREQGWARMGTADAASWAGFAYLGLVGSLLAFPTYIWLLKHESPARVSSYAYVNPVIAMIVGWLVLHETIPGRGLAAVPLLIGGIAMITRGTAVSPPGPADDENDCNFTISAGVPPDS